MIKTLLLLIFGSVLAFGQTTPHNVVLNWTQPVGGGQVTGYTVQRATTTGGPYATIGTVSGNPLATTYTDTSATGNTLLEGTKYFYVVEATGPGGTSGPSNEASATIPFSGPGVPTSLTATAH